MQGKNIILAGVGGQGTILASKILTDCLVKSGFDVKMSEIHGMSQRGGSVSSKVRFGKNILSPVIEKGTADVIVAFEKMEASRWLDYLKKDGIVILNDHEIGSIPILAGNIDYPEDTEGKISERVKMFSVDAANQAENLGNPRVMNIILLGAVVKALELEKLDWEESIRASIKKKFIEINLEAFDLGKNMV